MKNILLLGATGSIGKQTLDVIEKHPNEFKLLTIAIGTNIIKGIEIIKKFKPKYVSVINNKDALLLKGLFVNIEIGFGERGLINAATYVGNNNFKHIVVTAVVGSVGLVPTIEAIKKGYTIALANKETLVTAGHIVMDLAKEYNVDILPVDSEHSAIFQCLNGENNKQVKEIIITASGGSFRNKTREELETVTIEDALNHPNWNMGHKITIDSATMINKGFEVIEAHYLFGLPYENISTVLHFESVIHSMVEFVDSAIIAQIGTPDMRIPIQYALNFPNRLESNFGKSLKLQDVGTLNFKPMDFKRFPCLKYAYDSGKTGHSMPTVLNAANEAAVNLFLKKKISFLEIENIVYENLTNHKLINNPSLDDILSLDKEIKENILSKYLKGEI